MDQAETRRHIQQKMEAGDFSSAFTLCENAIAALATPQDSQNPATQKQDKIEALYLAACCARYLEQHATAHQYLADILSIEPFFGRAFLEEAHLYLSKNNLPDALRAYQRASEANPALLAAWRQQIQLLEKTENKAALRLAEQQLAYHESLPAPLLRAKHLLYEGRLAKAEALCKSFMQENPRHVDGMRLLADIFSRFGANAEAEQLLGAATQLRPHDSALMIEYLLILRKQQKFKQSYELCAQLVAQEPDNMTYRFQQAVEDMQAGQTETAIQTVNEMIAAEPANPVLHILLGHLNKTHGADEAAAQNYQQAIALRPDCGEAFYALANMKTYQFSAAEINAMHALIEANRCSMNDRIHIHFALGVGYEAMGDHAAAFEHYQAGNAAKNAQSSYTPEIMQQEFARQKEICTPALLSRQGGQGCPAPDPIFIVGLPRAGSTLIEQILASHSQIDGTLELPNILSLAHNLRASHQLGESAYPENLATLTGEELYQFGQDYIDNTQMHRAGAPFFTDKMPNNFRHIGLIHLILPNAKIIDARRNPMDCCFSGFKQLFAQGQEFTYGLEEIGRYYADYVDLMNHWNTVLPHKILRVQHEDLLDDIEGQVRQILDFLNLPFEPACIEFHKTKRAVRTASAAQVRQPINRKGVGAWRPFEPYLTPLKNALGAHYTPEPSLEENR